jgi:hypothetical protein
MLGREPRLPHGTMRWLIITLMLINGVQLVLLQLAINSSALYNVGETWTYVLISLAALLLSTGLIAYAFLRSRGSSRGSRITVKPSTPNKQGTVSSDEPHDQK